MKSRCWVLAGVLSLCGWLAMQIDSPSMAWTQHEAAASPDADHQDIDVRYAKAYLQLVETTLAKYQETNRRQPGVIRRGVIQALEDTVLKSRERVQVAEQGDRNHSDIYVVSAEATLRLANESLRKAESANRQRPGTIGQAESRASEGRDRTGQDPRRKGQAPGQRIPLGQRGIRARAIAGRRSGAAVDRCPVCRDRN